MKSNSPCFAARPRPRALTAIVALATLAGALIGPRSAGAEDKIKPIRALLITGGCCHDYEAQKKILSEGVSARAHVDWTIVHDPSSATNVKLPLYENADWAKGYDVVVHNECFADVAEPAWTERILKPHREGTPAVVIHCAMHCYRDKTDEWFKFLGVTSRGHGGNYPFEVFNLDTDNPIMQGFGEKWQTPAGELYFIEKLWPNTKPLGHAMSRDSKKNEVCIWTNMYEDKTRVFGTTIGHHNSEMADPVFLNYVTRGLLWAANALDEQHLKPVPPTAATSSVQPGPQPTPAKIPVNLGLHKPVTASSHQDDGRNPIQINDGDTQTRWCADGDRLPQWVQIDLEQPQAIAGVRLVWEKGDVPYQFQIEGSADGKTWKTLVDPSKSGRSAQEQQFACPAEDVRFVKLSITGAAPGAWASVFEMEVQGHELIDVRAANKPSAESARRRRNTLLAGVKAPPGFEVSVFAGPPDVSYPTCLAATPEGVVYVGVDMNGSLDAKPTRGSVVRCIDEDGDGHADTFNTFAEMDSPRGVHFDNGTLYVLHPPRLTAFHDDNGDGVADRSQVLVEGIGFDLKHRGADHTTNGMRLGIDGWFYIAVGDYGFVRATGADGQSAQLHGGGVVRVRTDGTGLEIVSRGQRNIYDVAVDPQLNLFTRDNTNDGGGWDVRLSHVVPTGHYGYPSLFTNFRGEIIQPLADYGGGSPCGSLFVDEAALPAPYGHALYTCEWGRSAVFRHPLTAQGASFTAGQETFVEIPRPTDMDVDAQGRLYVSSWKDGGFNYSGPNVGFVAEVRPSAATPIEWTDLRQTADGELPALLAAASHVRRLAVQREILRRGDKPAFAAGLEKLAAAHAELPVRIAAVFTLKQLRGASAQQALERLAADDTLRECVLRALADRRDQLQNVNVSLFLSALADPQPRVRLQAVIGLGRIRQTETAAAIVPLLADADPIIAHAAVQALVAIDNAAACLAAWDSGPADRRPGLARVLQSLHEPVVVAGVVERLQRTPDHDQQQLLLGALCRLYYQEAEWTGDWWGTRPDTSGPYYNRVAWSETDRIGAALAAAMSRSDADQERWLLKEMVRHKIEAGDTSARLLKLAATDPAVRSAAVQSLAAMKQPPEEAIPLLAEVAAAADRPAAERVVALRCLERLSDRPAGLAATAAELVALAAVGKAEKPDADLLRLRDEFVRDSRRAANVALFVEQAESDDPARSELASMVLLSLADQPALPPDTARVVDRALNDLWQQSHRAASLLRAIGIMRNERHALEVRAHRQDPVDEVRRAADFAAGELQLDRPSSSGPRIAELKFEDAVAQAVGQSGEVAAGAKLFVRQGCVNCHTTSPNEALKGPFLGGIAARYKRHELAESILRPSAKIAQGFETQFFVLDSGKVLEGFVVRESGDEVELRGSNGQTTLIAKPEIEERGRRELSVMPTGLADPLTVADLAALLSFLESLPAK